MDKFIYHHTSETIQGILGIHKSWFLWKGNPFGWNKHTPDCYQVTVSAITCARWGIKNDTTFDNDYQAF